MQRKHIGAFKLSAWLGMLFIGFSALFLGMTVTASADLHHVKYPKEVQDIANFDVRTKPSKNMTVAKVQKYITKHFPVLPHTKKFAQQIYDGANASQTNIAYALAQLTAENGGVQPGTPAAANITANNNPGNLQTDGVHDIHYKSMDDGMKAYFDLIHTWTMGKGPSGNTKHEKLTTVGQIEPFYAEAAFNKGGVGALGNNYLYVRNIRSFMKELGQDLGKGEFLSGDEKATSGMDKGKTADQAASQFHYFKNVTATPANLGVQSNKGVLSDSFMGQVEATVAKWTPKVQYLAMILTLILCAYIVIVPVLWLSIWRTGSTKASDWFKKLTLYDPLYDDYKKVRGHMFLNIGVAVFMVALIWSNTFIFLMAMIYRGIATFLGYAI